MDGMAVVVSWHMYEMSACDEYQVYVPVWVVVGGCGCG